MFPYEFISKALLRAELMMMIPFSLFSAALLRQKHLAKTRTLTQAPVFSDRSKIGMFRWAQGFFLGAILALAGAGIFVSHEQARFSHDRFIQLRLSSTVDPAHGTAATQKVR